MDQPTIGVSGCLLGLRVRFNGEHRKSSWISDHLSRVSRLVPVCPEVAMGLTVPRPALRLIQRNGRTRLVNPKTAEDHTDRADETAARLALQNIDWDGFIFKKDSPSCGLERVKVYFPTGIPQKTGAGIFAKAFKEHHPLVPAIEEGRLNDPLQKEHFVKRVFAYYRLKKVRFDPNRLREFHRKHQLLVMEHSPSHYSVLEGLLEEGWENYQVAFMQALEKPATRDHRYQVLMLIAEYFQKWVTAQEMKELFHLLQAYQNSFIPYSIPLMVLRYLVKRFSVQHLDEQWVFQPYPLIYLSTSL